MNEQLEALKRRCDQHKSLGITLNPTVVKVMLEKAYQAGRLDGRRDSNNANHNTQNNY